VRRRRIGVIFRSVGVILLRSVEVKECRSVDICCFRSVGIKNKVKKKRT